MMEESFSMRGRQTQKHNFKEHEPIRGKKDKVLLVSIVAGNLYQAPPN